MTKNELWYLLIDGQQDADTGVVGNFYAYGEHLGDALEKTIISSYLAGTRMTLSLARTRPFLPFFSNVVPCAESWSTEHKPHHTKSAQKSALRNTRCIIICRKKWKNEMEKSRNCRYRKWRYTICKEGAHLLRRTEKRMKSEGKSHVLLLLRLQI